jgi:hypothetical protein
MSFLNAARDGIVAMKQQFSESVKQNGQSFDANAQLQNIHNNNGEDPVEVSSGFSNPSSSHESEKYEFMESLRERLRSTYVLMAQKTIGEKLKTGITQFKSFGEGFTDAEKTVNGILVELGILIVKLGQLKSYGWKVNRIVDAWAMVSKYFLVQAESIRLEAPSVISVGSVSSSQFHLHETIADVQSVQVKDEIHRVAEAYGLDAKFLTILLQQTAKIYANKNIELMAKEDFMISAEEDLNITANLVKSSAVTTQLVDKSGGAITISNGIIHLNPISPPSPSNPVDVEDVEVLQATGYPRVSDNKPNLAGTQAHVAGII